MFNDDDTILELKLIIIDGGIDPRVVAISIKVEVRGEIDAGAVELNGISTIDGVDVIKSFEVRTISDFSLSGVERHIISPSIILVFEFNGDSHVGITGDGFDNVEV